MTHQISISAGLFARLQGHAVPLVDTIETALIRILDEFEASKATSDEGRGRLFDPSMPPNLGHTTVMSATLNGVALKPADTYWNNIFVAVIKAIAIGQGLTGENMAACITSNKVVGEKTDNGYKFIREAGISVQGLDANNAWKATNFLCVVGGVELDVTFRWQNKEGAEMPGGIGRFVIKKATSNS